MTVLTKERADALLALLPQSTSCDICSLPFKEPPIEAKEGPFPILICARCAWQRKKAEARERRGERFNLETGKWEGRMNAL